MSGSILRIFQMGNNNSMVAKIYSFRGRGNYIKFVFLRGFKHMSLLQLIYTYLFLFLGCQQLPCLGWNITLLCRGIIGQTFITGSI